MISAWKITTQIRRSRRRSRYRSTALEHIRTAEGQNKLRHKIRPLARLAFSSAHNRAASRSGSDPQAIKDLFSKGGLRLYYGHIPEAKGVMLSVTYADDDAPESD